MYLVTRSAYLMYKGGYMAYIISDISNLVRMIDPNRKFPGVLYERWFVEEFTHSFGIPASSISPYGDNSFSRDLDEFDRAVRLHNVDVMSYLPRVGADLCDLELWFLVYRNNLVIGDLSDVRKCYKLIRHRLQ